jgi:hypothetical protein
MVTLLENFMSRLVRAEELQVETADAGHDLNVSSSIGW